MSLEGDQMRVARLHKRRRLSLGIFTVSVTLVAGCAPSQPIVVNPTEPWEEELARERQAVEASQTSEGSVARQMYATKDNNEESNEPKNNAVVVAIADIIALPFRGAGWLTRQIF